MTEDYRVPVPDDVKTILQDMGRTIKGAMPPGWGFALLIFDFGEHGGAAGEGTLTYISNAQRDDMLKVMQEFLRKQGA